MNVGVHDDTAREIAEVVVEGPPGLVVYLLDREPFAGGKLDQRARALAENLHQCNERRHHPLGRDGVLDAPALVPVVQRPGTR